MGKKEKAILFGRGMVYQRKKKELQEKYDVVMFLDNAVAPGQCPQKEGETGIRVENPAAVCSYPDIPVILLSYAVGDMYRQLKGLGVCEDRILFGPMLEPYNAFERMLFTDGGQLAVEGEDIFYRNEKWGLLLRTDPSNLEGLVHALKDTGLYQSAGQILRALPLRPLDDTYGMNRGTPVDRYYIERFLEGRRSLIQGRVMEVGDRRYTLQFGGDRVKESVVLHVEGEDPQKNQIKGNFATGEGLPQEEIDCLVCTQTLPFIYDLHAAADHMVKILKPGGCALVTVAGISQIIQYEKIHYGHFWGFTDMSLRELFAQNPAVESVAVETYGNVKAACGFLYGISSEEMDKGELDFLDPDYQLIIAAVVKKKGMGAL